LYITTCILDTGDDETDEHRTVQKQVPTAWTVVCLTLWNVCKFFVSMNTRISSLVVTMDGLEPSCLYYICIYGKNLFLLASSWLASPVSEPPAS
jgi:hypothetical protein